jgi:RNA polymerase sigma-70 factor, ECF subfamily
MTEERSDSAGERGFFAWVTRLVREHRAELAAIARGEGLRAEDALDAVQEAFITFLTIPHARRLSGEVDDSRRLLGVLVRNHARNRRRRHDLARAHVSDVETVDALADNEASVDALIADAEVHVAAFGCVEKLGEVQRLVVTLRLLEDRPGEAVAASLAMTPSNVGVTLHRAKRALRACVEAIN